MWLKAAQKCVCEMWCELNEVILILIYLRIDYEICQLTNILKKYKNTK